LFGLLDTKWDIFSNIWVFSIHKNLVLMC
jgi:hypothetical protein